MENLTFIDPLLHGIKAPAKKTVKLSVKHLVIAGLGALIAGAVLKKSGQNKTAAVVGSLALPLLASAGYKQLTQTSKAKRERNESSGIEYNH
jgi:hypothetical protein